MKKIFMLPLSLLIICSILIAACEKDTAMLTPENNSKSDANSRITQQPETGQSIVPPIFYQTCNRDIKLFNPTSGNYTFAIPVSHGYRKFGLPGYAVLNFEVNDVVKFKFSGVYAGPNNDVKLYYIQRSDYKYLTFQIGLEYKERLPETQSNRQLWIINDLGNNKYNLLLPKLPTCYLGRIFQEGSTFRFGTIPSDYTIYPGSTTIYILPVAPLPPGAN